MRKQALMRVSSGLIFTMGAGWTVGLAVSVFSIADCGRSFLNAPDSCLRATARWLTVAALIAIAFLCGTLSVRTFRLLLLRPAYAPSFQAARGLALVAAAASALLPLYFAAAAWKQALEPGSAALARCAVDATPDGVNPSDCVLREMQRSERSVFLDGLWYEVGSLTVWGVAIAVSFAQARKPRSRAHSSK